VELGKHGLRIARGYQLVKYFAGNGGNWGLNGNSGDWRLEVRSWKFEIGESESRDEGDPNRRRGKRFPRTGEAPEKSKVKSATRKKKL
jgi:hypothetical protein